MGRVDSCDPQSNSKFSQFFSSPLSFHCKSKMKCFVSVLGLIGAAAAAPQFIADTPEVQEAKIAFAKAFNKAARGSAIALEQAGVQDTDPNDPDYSPPAVPYVHVDIPAEPYVHDEPNFIDEPAQPAAAPAAPAPVAPAPFQAPVQAPAPAVQNTQQLFNPFAFNAQPVQQQQFAFNPQQAFAPQALAFNPQQQQFAFNPQQQQQLAFPQQFAFPEQARAATGCFNNKGAAVACRS